MSFRRGPLDTEIARQARYIAYEEHRYTYPGFMAAPAIILQQRGTKTRHCSTNFGSTSLETLWHATKKSELCQKPYRCPSKLLTSPTYLIGCDVDNPPDHFFGMDSE